MGPQLLARDRDRDTCFQYVLPLEQATEHPLPRGEQEKEEDAVESTG